MLVTKQGKLREPKNKIKSQGAKIKLRRKQNNKEKRAAKQKKIMQQPGAKIELKKDRQNTMN